MKRGLLYHLGQPPGPIPMPRPGPIPPPRFPEPGPKFPVSERQLCSWVCCSGVKTLRASDALEWLAAMCSHIPDRGEQMVRYYGYYSNVSRGKRKETEDDGVPAILEADKSPEEYGKNWARLIQKIYEVDPLICPKCGGIMRILAFIEDQEVIKAILKHLGLWLVRSKPTRKAHAPCPEPERIGAGGIRPGSILATSHKRRSALPGP